MSDIKRCGIYSFPKSGNTWMRELIRALFEIDEPTSTAIPDIYENGVDGKVVLSNSGQQWKFYKSHSKSEVVSHQNNSVVNDLIIYIVRNPYDVFCSQLNYVLRGFEKNKGRMILTSNSVDEAADLGLIEEYFSAFTVYGTLDPYFWDAGNWKENVSNWLDMASKDERVVIIRYEDMVEDINKALVPVANRLGVSADKINSAFELADTRTNDGGKFFWKKSSGTYKNYLLEKNIDKFKKYHSDILIPLGYEEY